MRTQFSRIGRGRRCGLAIAGAAFGVAVLTFTVGCTFKGGPSVVEPDRGDGDMSASTSADGQAVWHIRPTTMRVFPSSRFAEIDGQPVLVARVELIDEMGDSVKGVGHFRFELFEGGSQNQPSTQNRLYSWDVPLLTLEQNRAYYDQVTRTYLVNLFLDESRRVTQNSTLVVSFMPVSGKRIEAHGVFEAGANRPADGN